MIRQRYILPWFIRFSTGIIIEFYRIKPNRVRIHFRMTLYSLCSIRFTPNCWVIRHKYMYYYRVFTGMPLIIHYILCRTIRKNYSAFCGQQTIMAKIMIIAAGGTPTASSCWETGKVKFCSLSLNKLIIFKKNK